MLSSKQIGTICFAIFSFISAPTFATGVSSGASSAGCDNSTLSTYSGTSNLQADWQANTIALHWYNGDDELTVAGASQSCVYDGALTPPTTIPTKTGYTFKGWRVRVPQCFSSSVCGVTGSVVAALDLSEMAYISNDGQNTSNTSMYGLTSTGTWAMEYTGAGIARGIAVCNSDSRGWNMNSIVIQGMQNGTITTFDEIGDAVYGSCSSGAIQPSNTFNTSSTGQYCWCKMTSWTPSGDSACSMPSSSWVAMDLLNMNPSAENCAGYCAYQCASNSGTRAFIRAMFGVSQ